MMYKKPRIMIFVLFTLITTFVYAQSVTKVRYLSSLDFQKESLITNNTLIDIRTPEEFASGHLKGAKIIDFRQGDFANQIKKLNHKQTTLIYCRSGHRTESARVEFEKQNFKEIVILKGGIQSWNSANLPMKY
ncbi:MAG: rhodanese-like domain-containing protein [Candidatus Riflemargulisbacteria bacterium]